MKIKDIINNNNFKLLTNFNYIDKDIKKFYASDLLSFVMANAKEGYALVTIIANINVLAIAKLLDLSCIILTSNVIGNEDFVRVANKENIAVFYTDLDTASAIIELHEKV